MSFVTDWVGLIVQAVMFSFVGRMIDPSKLPVYGGSRATYMEFIAIGIAVGVFVQISLGQVAAGIRQEQLMGTLESVLMTPTAPATIQIGSVIYQLVYVPIRTALFLVLVAVSFGLSFQPSGILPAAALLICFIPFVWGLGVASAAATLTYRRGSGAFGLGIGLLTLISGAYFPLQLLPHWLSSVAKLNPIAIALNGMRQALLGGAGWSQVGVDILTLLPISVCFLAFGIAAFRRAMRRERRRGTLGLY